MIIHNNYLNKFHLKASMYLYKGSAYYRLFTSNKDYNKRVFKVKVVLIFVSRFL